MSYLSLSGDWSQLAHDDSHQCCLAFAVSSYQSDLLAPADFYLGVLEDYFLRISYCQVGTLEYDIAGARCRREFHDQCRVVRLVNLDSVQLFQCFDSGLNLI